MAVPDGPGPGPMAVPDGLGPLAAPAAAGAVGVVPSVLVPRDRSRCRARWAGPRWALMCSGPMGLPALGAPVVAPMAVPPLGAPGVAPVAAPPIAVTDGFFPVAGSVAPGIRSLSLTRLESRRSCPARA